MAKIRTGAAVADMSGPYGEYVIRQGRSGLVLRRKPVFKRPIDPDQQAGMSRMQAATAAWNNLTYAEAQAWRDYAATQTRHNQLTGQPYAPAAVNVFTGLALKVLQVNRAEIVPALPPSSAFVGDEVTVSLSTRHGLLTFTASAPNSAGVVTELLIQKLPNPRRSLTKQYKSAAFKAFTSDSMSESLLVEPGLYGAAYRFVRDATGQATEMLLLPVIEVA
jgi:hypothetical protein